MGDKEVFDDVTPIAESHNKDNKGGGIRHLYWPDAVESGHREDLYGPQGWTTTSGIADLLVPFRDRGGEHCGGIQRFDVLSAPCLRRIRERICKRNLRDQQNKAPSCASMISCGCEFPHTIRVGGYLVSPPRWDERLSFDTLVIVDCPQIRRSLAAELCDTEPWTNSGDWSCSEVWEPLLALLRLTGECGTPDEVSYTYPAWAPGHGGWRLWWD